MTPIEEYNLELISTYAFYVLTWTYDNLVILYYYLSSLATIVLLEYLFLFFTGKKKTEIIWCLCKVWKKFIFQDELKQMISPKKWLADLREKIKLLRNLLLSCAEGTTQVILLESTSFSSKSRHYLSENLSKLWMDYFFFLPISMFT